jgi:hypothetical protein
MHRVRRQLVQLIARSLASPPGAAGGSGRRAQPVSATAPIGARALGCSMRPTTRNQAHDRTTRFAPAGSAGGRGKTKPLLEAGAGGRFASVQTSTRWRSGCKRRGRVTVE